MGANVTVVDSGVAGCGANPLKRQGAASTVRVIDADIGDAPAFAAAGAPPRFSRGFRRN
jgi:hypothetical protein